MTLAVTKHFLSRDLCYFKILKIMNAFKISKFFFFFTLRQGSLLIAIIELWLTSFVLLLLLLSVTHAEFLMDLVSEELLQLEKNNITSTSFETYYFRNEQKMLTGQHLASVMLIMIYAGIVLTSIHFISCLLLLYGTLRNKPNYLLPWTTTVFLSLISGLFILLLLFYLPSDRCKFGLFAANLSLIGLEFYAWLTVFSHYRELKS